MSMSTSFAAVWSVQSEVSSVAFDKSILLVLAKSSPNLVVSSKPNEMIRFAAAIRYAAHTSPSSVAS